MSSSSLYLWHRDLDSAGKKAHVDDWHVSAVTDLHTALTSITASVFWGNLWACEQTAVQHDFQLSCNDRKVMKKKNREKHFFFLFFRTTDTDNDIGKTFPSFQIECHKVQINMFYILFWTLGVRCARVHWKMKTVQMTNSGLSYNCVRRWNQNCLLKRTVCRPPCNSPVHLNDF